MSQVNIYFSVLFSFISSPFLEPIIFDLITIMIFMGHIIFLSFLFDAFLVEDDVEIETVEHEQSQSQEQGQDNGEEPAKNGKERREDHK